MQTGEPAETTPDTGELDLIKETVGKKTHLSLQQKDQLRAGLIKHYGAVSMMGKHDMGRAIGCGATRPAAKVGGAGLLQAFSHSSRAPALHQ